MGMGMGNFLEIVLNFGMDWMDRLFEVQKPSPTLQFDRHSRTHYENNFGTVYIYT